MKKLFAITLTLSIVLVVCASAAAPRWEGNHSYKAQSVRGHRLIREADSVVALGCTVLDGGREMADHSCTYRCIKNHKSSPQTQPLSGPKWREYWEKQPVFEVWQ